MNITVKKIHALLLAVNLALSASAAIAAPVPGLAMSPELFSAIATEGDAPNAAAQLDGSGAINLDAQDKFNLKRTIPGDPALQDRVAAPDPAQFKSEFQDFVAQSVGKSLPMFGYELFRKAPDTFSQLTTFR